MVETPRLGLWDRTYAGSPGRAVYGDPLTVEKAAAFFKHREIATVEDWGCGLGGLKNHLAKRQRYIGVDGSRSPYADVIADLEHYKSEADAIHLRHVLEHNPRWEIVLDNVLRSFRRRLVLTLFTPLMEETRVIAEYPNFNGTGVTMVDIAFRREDIVSRLTGFDWKAQEGLRTRTQYGVEHMYFLRRV